MISGPGAVTLSNVKASNNSAAGVYVVAMGTITLNNPDVESNLGPPGRVYLHNDSGTGGVVVQGTASDPGLITKNSNGRELDIKTTGSVTVNYLDLSYSSEDGLYIDNSSGSGAVSLNQVSSNYNSGSGVEIISQGAVTLSGLQSYWNAGYGLNVVTKGTITLTSLEASHDNTLGLETYVVVLNNSSGTGGVMMNGTTNAWNVIENNTACGGLLIQTNGAVTLNDIETDFNPGGNGLEIQEGGTGAVTLTNATSKSNGDMGILVTAKGTITLTNPNVQDNLSGSAGVSLDNTSGTGGIIVQGSSTNSGYIESNHNGTDTSGTELVIATNGSVTASYLFLTGAYQDGLDIDNTGGIGTVTLNVINSNGNSDGVGVSILSHGAVTITGSDFSDNGGKGLFIQNNGGAAANVTLSNLTAQSNHDTGIEILSKGAVSLTGIISFIQVSNGSGLYVDNTSGTAGITLTNTGSAMNTFNDNPDYGVYFLTNGAVVINNTQANYNGLTGINVDNASGSGSITLNTVTADHNATNGGIILNTSGSITASGIDASYNTASNGLAIAISGAVTFTNGNFYDNGQNGLTISSIGTISMTNVTADDNSSGYGASLINSDSTASTPPGVIVKNSGTLMNSFGTDWKGLYIQTKGAVVLGNINAMYDHNTSIRVDNTAGTAGVTLTNINVDAYAGDAFDVLTKGAVTGSALSSQGNSSGVAISIDNCQLSGVCTGSGNVTLTTVTANGGSNGLSVTSNGSISVSSLTAQENSIDSGAVLDNSHSSISGSVSVVSANVSNNGANGIYITSKGSVTLNGITANNNTGDDGVFVDNSAGTGNVSVLNTKGANTFNGNLLNGIECYSQGLITVTGATASNNQRNGLILSSTGTGKTITLTTVTASHNSYTGIETTSHGAQTFTGIQAISNGDSKNADGIDVSTNGYDFTLSNSNVFGNGRYGINALVGGLTHNVRVIKTDYFGNGQYGSTKAPDIYTDGNLEFS